MNSMLKQKQKGNVSQSNLKGQNKLWLKRQQLGVQRSGNDHPLGSFTDHNHFNHLPIGEQSPTFFSSLPIQAKLTIGQPNDKYEREADAMADRVMRMPDNKQNIQASTALISRSIQRKCSNCNEDEKKKKKAGIMRKAEAGVSGFEASPSLVSQLNATNGGGQALPDSTRSFMENAFNADFSGVRIHTDRRANIMSEEINARAFTSGSGIYFNSGEYSPYSQGGKRLLGHELMHIIQQRSINRNILCQREKDQSNEEKDTQSTPEWLSKNFEGDLPGSFVPGYERKKIAYTREDTNKMRLALKKRFEDNVNNIAKFTREIVEAAVEISGKYISSEMRKAAERSGMSNFAKFLKYALGEALQAIATGGVSVFTSKLNKSAVEALKFLANHTAGLTYDFMGSEVEQKLLSRDLEKKESVLNKITDELSKELGAITFKMVNKIGEGSEIDRAFWLASPENSQELHRFRIPEAFPEIDKQSIRILIASAISNHAHTHYRAYGKIGEESYILGPGESINDRNQVHHLDDNIIIVHLRIQNVSDAYIQDAQFFSSSGILSNEIINKAKIGQLATVPLFIPVNANKSDDYFAAKKLMRSLLNYSFSSDPILIETVYGSYIPPSIIKEKWILDQSNLEKIISQFLNFWSRDNWNKMIIRRNADGQITICDSHVCDLGGFAESIWLYSLATGDTELESLAEDVFTKLPLKPGFTDEKHSYPNMRVSSVREFSALNFHPYVQDGLKQLINKGLTDIRVNEPENRFKREYWTKDNRFRFWKRKFPLSKIPNPLNK